LAFGAFHKKHLLKLELSHQIIKSGYPITVTVTDGVTGKPISGAAVGGQLTNTNGNTIIRFTNLGTQKLKAEREDSIRSNAITVSVTA
jgi:hypothetical protein